MKTKDTRLMNHPSNGARRVFASILAGAVAMSSAVAAPAAGPTVDITKFAFTPNELTVAPGTTVTWINHDEVPHTVSSKDNAVVSKALDTNDRFEQTFTGEGDFAYFCTLHPFMTGVVHIRKP